MIWVDVNDFGDDKQISLSTYDAIIYKNIFYDEAGVQIQRNN